jgi:hypothetical protein
LGIVSFDLETGTVWLDRVDDECDRGGAWAWSPSSGLLQKYSAVSAVGCSDCPIFVVMEMVKLSVFGVCRLEVGLAVWAKAGCFVSPRSEGYL